MQGISLWQLDNPTRGLRSIQLDIQSLKRRNSASRSIRPLSDKVVRSLQADERGAQLLGDE